MMGAPRRDAQTAGVSLGVLITTAEREQDLFLFHKLGSDESGISQLVFQALDKHQLKVEVLKRM